MWLYFVVAILVKSIMASNVNEVDVLILGAGIAGIKAGNHLQSNNLTNFLILEAQNYIGGRIKQAKVGNVTVGEGANWVHYVEDEKKNPIWVLANEINLDKYMNNEDDIVVKNTVHSKTDYEKTLKTFKDIQAVVTADNEENPRNEDQPLSSALLANGWFPDTPLKKTVGWLLDYDYGVNSALISSRHYEGLPGENEFVTDSRGFKGIVDYLAQNITSKIKTEKAITQIKYGSNGIEVRTKDNETYKAKYGLCTFSTGVLASDLVEFIPELPKWKKEAISRIPLAYYTNIFVKFSNAFWEDNEFIINAGSIAETFPYLYNLNKKGIHKDSNVLLFTAVEENSLRIETQSKNETITEVMKTLREMYPNISIPQPTEIYVGQFSQNPYIRGSFSNAVVGSTLADFHNLQGRLGNLFFAGEATQEDYWGFTQGGYLSGLKQAEVILACLNRKNCPEYKPENADVCKTKDTVPSTGNIVKSSSNACFLLIVGYILFV